jgi:hypothetical protein
VAVACDFSKAGTIVDVGGSDGHMLAAIVKANPKLKGILFDLGQVLEQARRVLYMSSRELAGRIELAAGDALIRMNSVLGDNMSDAVSPEFVLWRRAS